MEPRRGPGLRHGGSRRRGGSGGFRRRHGNGSGAGQSLEQLEPVELLVDIAHPFANIATQHEGKIAGLAVSGLVVDEVLEGDVGQIHLLVGDLVELRNVDLIGRIDLGEIFLVGLLVPVEEARLVDEIARDDIIQALDIFGDFTHFLERGDGRTDDVKEAQVELAVARGLERADAVERIERDGEIARPEVDEGNTDIGRVERVEDLHLVGDAGEIDDLGDGGIEAL